MNKTENENRFIANRKYFTISIYCIMVFAVCALVIKLIFTWDSVTAMGQTIMNVISPYLIGIFIAYLLNPFVTLLDRYILEQKLHVKFRFIRGVISILLTYIVALGLLVLIIRFIIPELASSLSDIVMNKLPSWYKSSTTWLEEYVKAHPYLYQGESITEEIETSLAGLINMESVSNLLQTLMPSVLTTSVSVVKWVGNLLIALIVSIYMLADKSILAKASSRILFAFIDKEKANHFLATLKECNKIFGGFIWGKTIDSIIIGILCFISMVILRMPYAVLISVVVGITNMIPYLGPYIGAVPGAFILLVSAPQLVIPYLIMILVIQQFDGWILGPKILGDFTGLRPLLILFAISIGGAIAGVPGMFLGVPTMAVIQYLASTWVDNRLLERGVTDEDVYHPKKTLDLKDIFFSR